MEILKFNLSGETAFFKKPDVNTYYYFTYGNIHRIALLGIIGAMLGLNGYAFQDETDDYPEFYEKLKDIKISILPNNEKGLISKKIQIFNNAVGYANKDGGILNVREQWLEKPNWTIYIQIHEGSLFNDIKERLLNMRFEYIPYLGKNDHYANIKNVEIIEKDNIQIVQKTKIKKIDSLFLKSDFNIAKFDLNMLFDKDFDESAKWKYEEYLPVELDKTSNQYIKKPFIHTNMKVEPNSDKKIYNVKEKYLQFI
ncbi:type I-B CRISPR-associated protein Cas5b [Sedimentibacter sp. MB31-C6]|uniref:type I-B CRISPR-associated protein Cas5b n=1 Tax=Sedimentibacter sp. MB31-C6 TaxID=3109366 RepID=UPI002DDCBB59|nr:type I-B CRISPR-associated protein Cas5b [Sedimentibacter sp. MB36-C1]WSI05057.1 type I-B CRISPR-associated protein Cas5b [Sedimentibacter sp. MB36-C1]